MESSHRTIATRTTPRNSAAAADQTTTDPADRGRPSVVVVVVGDRLALDRRVGDCGGGGGGEPVSGGSTDREALVAVGKHPRTIRREQRALLSFDSHRMTYCF